MTVGKNLDLNINDVLHNRRFRHQLYNVCYIYSASFTMSNDDYTDDDLEIRSLLPFFYPSSRTTPPDPCSTAARIEDDLRTNPENTAFIATTLPAFIFFTATSVPAHIDNVLQTTQILLHTSLPLVNIPRLCRPNATFASLFFAMFPDDFNASISGPVLVPECETYIAMSLLGARARSMDIINTPECVGKLAYGLGFPERVSFHYQSEQAEIAAMGSCIQLLGGASLLMRDQPVRFAKDKILDALDRLESGQNDALIKVRRLPASWTL